MTQLEELKLAYDECSRQRFELLAKLKNTHPQQDGPINDGWQITVAHGHSGYGVYAHMEDYPEEGAVLVQAIEKQEPVAWLYKSPMPDGSVFVGASAERLQIGVGVTPDSTEQPLYTHPHEWQGLTDEEIDDLAEFHGLDFMSYSPFVRAIEAKLKEKNNAA